MFSNVEIVLVYCGNICTIRDGLFDLVLECFWSKPQESLRCFVFVTDCLLFFWMEIWITFPGRITITSFSDGVNGLEPNHRSECVNV